jgi:hypothetical protein
MSTDDGQLFAQNFIRLQRFNVKLFTHTHTHTKCINFFFSYTEYGTYIIQIYWSESATPEYFLFIKVIYNTKII